MNRTQTTITIIIKKITNIIQLLFLRYYKYQNKIRRSNVYLIILLFMTSLISIIVVKRTRNNISLVTYRFLKFFFSKICILRCFNNNVKKKPGQTSFWNYWRKTLKTKFICNANFFEKKYFFELNILKFFFPKCVYYLYANITVTVKLFGANITGQNYNHRITPRNRYYNKLIK